MPDANSTPFHPITIATHRDFLKNMKEIVTRLNNNQEIAKLVLVNPIYALQDLGVQLSDEMKDHLFQTFHSPPARDRRLKELDEELRAELDKLPAKPAIPSTPEELADLVFRQLGIAPRAAGHEARLDREALLDYSLRHPLIPKLIEYERIKRGGLVFFPRAIYDSYRRGEAKQPWLNSIRFGSPPAS